MCQIDRLDSVVRLDYNICFNPKIFRAYGQFAFTVKEEESERASQREPDRERAKNKDTRSELNVDEVASLRHLNEILSFRGWSTINRKQINSMLREFADRHPIRMMKLLISRMLLPAAFFRS